MDEPRLAPKSDANLGHHAKSGANLGHHAKSRREPGPPAKIGERTWATSLSTPLGARFAVALERKLQAGVDA